MICQQYKQTNKNKTNCSDVWPVASFFSLRCRWCGKHQTLNISKSGGEGNGAAAAVVGSRAEEREQEMVTLMNKEKIQENGNAEEFTAITVEGSSEKA